MIKNPCFFRVIRASNLTSQPLFIINYSSTLNLHFPTNKIPALRYHIGRRESFYLHKSGYVIMTN